MRGFILVGVFLVLAGCTVLDGSGQGGVTNDANHFDYGGNFASRSTTDTFHWSNDHATAEIRWGGNVADGSLALRLQDSAGAEVYSGTIGKGQGGTVYTSKAGAPGSWTITIVFSGFTGQMGLSINAG